MNIPLDHCTKFQLSYAAHAIIKIDHPKNSLFRKNDVTQVVRENRARIRLVIFFERYHQLLARIASFEETVPSFFLRIFRQS